MNIRILELIDGAKAAKGLTVKSGETATMEIVSMNDMSEDMNLGGGSSCNGTISQLSKKAGKQLVDFLLTDL